MTGEARIPPLVTGASCSLASSSLSASLNIPLSYPSTAPGLSLLSLLLAAPMSPSLSLSISRLSGLPDAPIGSVGALAIGVVLVLDERLEEFLDRTMGTGSLLLLGRWLARMLIGWRLRRIIYGTGRMRCMRSLGATLLDEGCAALVPGMTALGWVPFAAVLAALLLLVLAPVLALMLALVLALALALVLVLRLGCETANCCSNKSYTLECKTSTVSPFASTSPPRSSQWVSVAASAASWDRDSAFERSTRSTKALVRMYAQSGSRWP